MTIYYALTVLRLRVQDARDGEAYGICELGEEQGQAKVLIVPCAIALRRDQDTLPALEADLKQDAPRGDDAALAPPLGDSDGSACGADAAPRAPRARHARRAGAGPRGRAVADPLSFGLCQLELVNKEHTCVLFGSSTSSEKVFKRSRDRKIFQTFA